MRCLARFAVRHSYYFSLLVGMLSFEFDFRRRRLRLTRRSVVYAAVANVCILGVMPLLYYWNMWYNFSSRACLLHERLFLAITLVRAFSVVMTFAGNWRHRAEFIDVFRGFLQLHRQHFRDMFVRSRNVSTLLERGIWHKYVAITLSELLIFVISLRSFHELLTLRVAIGMFGISSFMAMLNTAFSHYYFAVLQVHVHYQLIRAELEAIVAETKSAAAMRHDRRLVSGRGLGLYITRCCELADRLDVLAVAERRLHNLSDRINAMYSAQAFCISHVFYMTSMSMLYFLYYMLRHNGNSVDRSYGALLIVIAAALAYYKDLHTSMFLIFNTIDLHRECAEVLRGYLQLPVLDPRLQLSFESFTLQMQCRPLVFDILSMYKMDKVTACMFFSQLLQQVIVLIQHDLKTNKI